MVGDWEAESFFGHEAKSNCRFPGSGRNDTLRGAIEPITFGWALPLNFGLSQDARCYTSPVERKTEMNPQPYQNAYDTAINELTQIAAAFEKLRERKGQLESLVQALQPFFGEGQAPAAAHEQAGSAVVPAMAASAAEPPEGYSFRDVPNPLPDISETGGDPFQRRVKATFRFKGLAAQRSL